MTLECRCSYKNMLFRLINLPSNDWEIFYWAVGQKETPEDFDNIVMDMLKEHAKNNDRESRVVMPELN